MLAQLLWNSRDMLPLVVTLAAALVTAVVWLYPAQVRNVRLPWRWALPGLRAAGLLVLAVSLLTAGLVTLALQGGPEETRPDMTEKPVQLRA